MAWAFEQAPTPVVETDGDGVLAITLGSAVSVGQRIILGFTYRDVFSGTLTVDSVTDSLGNTYAVDKRQIITEASDQYQYVEGWSAPVTTAGTPTITVNISSADPNKLVVAAVVYSGLDTTGSPLDGTPAGGAGNSTSAASGSTSATTAANELVIGIIGIPNNSSNSGLTASGFTERAALFSAFGHGLWIGEMDSGASGGTESVSSTLADTAFWGAICLVYKLASAGAAAVLSGTAIGGITEADVVAGGKVITVTLTGDTFIA